MNVSREPQNLNFLVHNLALCCSEKNTMTAVTLTKNSIYQRLSYSFRNLLHYLLGRKHGCILANMTLEKELSSHLDLLASRQRDNKHSVGFRNLKAHLRQHSFSNNASPPFK